MNLLSKFKKPIVKKIAGVIFAGSVAIIGAISDQKRDEEFEELKKKVSKLSELKEE